MRLQSASRLNVTLLFHNATVDCAVHALHRRNLLASSDVATLVLEPQLSTWSWGMFGTPK